MQTNNGFVTVGKEQVLQFINFLRCDRHRFKQPDGTYKLPFHEFKPKDDVKFFLKHAPEVIVKLYDVIQDYNDKADTLIEANMTINQAIVDANLVNYDTLAYPKTPIPPKAHQRLAFNAATKFDRYGLFCEPGLGKTKLSLDILQYYINKGDVKTCIIVCPLSVISSWQKEWDKNKVCNAQLFVLRNKYSIASYMEAKGPAIGLINWDSLFKWVKQKPDMVIFDESTKAKTHNTKRTKSAIELSDHAKKVLALTGTVITNNLMDIWSQYRIIDGGRMFRSSFYSFKNHYFMPIDVNKYTWVPKGGTVEDISLRIFAQAIVIKKAHCLDLPEKIYEVRDIELQDAEKRIYDKMKNEFIISLNDKVIEAQNVLSQMAKLRQLTSGFIYDGERNVHRMVNKSKFNELLEVLDEFGNEKVVIWACFREEIKFLLDNIKNSIGLYGDTSANVKNIIKEFVEGKTQYLICNPATAGHGVDSLQTVCSSVIYYSNPMSVEQRLQSEDRTHRMGMRGAVTYIDLVCKGTIDQAILKSLKQKIDVSNKITDINSVKQMLEGE